VRIAHVSDFCLPRLGGIEIHIAGLVEHQRAAGHVVDVVTALGGDGSPLARTRPSRSREVKGAVLGGGYDQVHCHAGLFTPLAFGAAVAASRAGIPTVVTMHSLLDGARAPLRSLDLATHWTQLPIAWTAVSERAADPLQRLLDPATPVRVLPNAIDTEAWQVSPVRRDPDHVVIVAVNRLAARKRPLPLLRALRDARAAVPAEIRMTAVVVGDGPQRAALDRAVARAQMRDWVHLTGRLSHRSIRRLYRRADVFVAPARLESFGIAALEARAAGVPVIGMARAGVGTFIGHGREGLLVDDDRGLAAAIAALTADTATRESIAAHNRVHPPAFGWADALASTEREYARAAAIQGVAARRGSRVEYLTRVGAGA